MGRTFINTRVTSCLSYLFSGTAYSSLGSRCLSAALLSKSITAQIFALCSHQRSLSWRDLGTHAAIVAKNTRSAVAACGQGNSRAVQHELRNQGHLLASVSSPFHPAW